MNGRKRDSDTSSVSSEALQIFLEQLAGAMTFPDKVTLIKQHAGIRALLTKFALGWDCATLVAVLETVWQLDDLGTQDDARSRALLTQLVEVLIERLSKDRYGSFTVPPTSATQLRRALDAPDPVTPAAVDPIRRHLDMSFMAVLPDFVKWLEDRLPKNATPSSPRRASPRALARAQRRATVFSMSDLPAESPSPSRSRFRSRRRAKDDSSSSPLSFSSAGGIKLNASSSVGGSSRLSRRKRWRRHQAKDSAEASSSSPAALQLLMCDTLDDKVNTIQDTPHLSALMQQFLSCHTPRSGTAKECANLWAAWRDLMPIQDMQREPKDEGESVESDCSPPSPRKLSSDALATPASPFGWKAILKQWFTDHLAVSATKPLSLDAQVVAPLAMRISALASCADPSVLADVRSALEPSMVTLVFAFVHWLDTGAGRKAQQHAGPDAARILLRSGSVTSGLIKNPPSDHDAAAQGAKRGSLSDRSSSPLDRHSSPLTQEPLPDTESMRARTRSTDGASGMRSSTVNPLMLKLRSLKKSTDVAQSPSQIINNIIFLMKGKEHWRTVLYTVHYWTTPVKLFQSIRQRFIDDPDGDPDAASGRGAAAPSSPSSKAELSKRSRRSRAFEFIVYWTKHFFYHFVEDTELARVVLDFASSICEANQWGYRIMYAFRDGIQAYQRVGARLRDTNVEGAPTPLVDPSQTFVQANVRSPVHQIPARELARQLVVLESPSFLRLSPNELIQLRWRRQGPGTGTQRPKSGTAPDSAPPEVRRADSAEFMRTVMDPVEGDEGSEGGTEGHSYEEQACVDAGTGLEQLFRLLTADHVDDGDAWAHSSWDMSSESFDPSRPRSARGSLGSPLDSPLGSPLGSPLALAGMLEQAMLTDDSGTVEGDSVSITGGDGVAPLPGESPRVHDVHTSISPASLTTPANDGEGHDDDEEEDVDEEEEEEDVDDDDVDDAGTAAKPAATPKRLSLGQWELVEDTTFHLGVTPRGRHQVVLTPGRRAMQHAAAVAASLQRDAQGKQKPTPAAATQGPDSLPELSSSSPSTAPLDVDHASTMQAGTLSDAMMPEVPAIVSPDAGRGSGGGDKQVITSRTNSFDTQVTYLARLNREALLRKNATNFEHGDRVDTLASTKEVMSTSPNVKRIIRWYNRLSAWVATEVLVARLQEDRVRLIAYWIRVCHYLYKMGNMNTLFACMDGLKMHPVARLRDDWDALPHKAASLWSDMTSVLDPMSHYTAYRDLLRRRQNQAMMTFPYLGLVLQDLTGVEEGNADFVTGTPSSASVRSPRQRLVNWEKLRMIGRCLHDFRMHQRACIDAGIAVQVVPGIQHYLRSSLLPIETDHELLYSLSCSIRPAPQE